MWQIYEHDGQISLNMLWLTFVVVNIVNSKLFAIEYDDL